MAPEAARAAKLRHESNAKFRKRDLKGAIEGYTETIEIAPLEPVSYGNRALARLRELVGGAVFCRSLPSHSSPSATVSSPPQLQEAGEDAYSACALLISRQGSISAVLRSDSQRKLLGKWLDRMSRAELQQVEKERDSSLRDKRVRWTIAPAL